VTAADERALTRLLGAGASPRASTDDLQGLLLQVVFALLMIFMIAYFLFVESSKKERQEEVLALNRQKLVLALEQTAENRRTRYGLNALMVQGTDGVRTFDADAHFRGGKLSLAPAAKEAFAAGSRAAVADYADAASLTSAWESQVLSAAGLKVETLSEDERAWLSARISENAEAVRLDARGVQRALATRLLRRWVERPDTLASVRDPGALADQLRIRSLARIAEETGAEILP